MYKKDRKEEENFWVSYADLMAGLLFVFILVIASIVIKYLYTQHSLEDSEDAKSQLFYELAKTKNMYEKSLEDLKGVNQKIVLSNKEVEKLKALLLEYDINIKDEKSKNESLNLALSDSSNQITLKDEELKLLADKLLVQTQIHQKMVEDFDIAKLKIKTLTGIKLNVIAKLKEKLGNSINVDEKSGAIKFSSNILFDQNSYILKEEAKKELSSVLKNYLSLLLDDKEISKYIENITIEGHTNSDGTYLANLLLSQQRALAVMQFLYEGNIVDKKLLSTFVNSSGRSSADLILDKKGLEDKDASRRIEIKFNIKNEEAIKEIQKYLDKQNENRVQ
ncbi:chemotaxis protein [Aliarcobacter trophiarum LMG 25534]|uniref:Chemotaxis protein n=1 Tax=Aliarcobacter trophiarum LMG 25534 TaxID=1032241 RepID=A0AAD0QHR2_9BACT|nr:OmpA family protein [Aliarcobacter trophiarum]AXK48057.1 OmpA domain-containing protein [Aliarcobacter trophiarum LMG 25534]RXI27793.1 chemotaxis protein [Aliarcobacter trophiarum]RXJ93261.1 chemotaxis protein [Aliarcobacter trophiarum LMG 25534]